MSVRRWGSIRYKKINVSTAMLMAELQALREASNTTLASTDASARLQAVEQATYALLSMVEVMGASVEEIRIGCDSAGNHLWSTFFTALFGALVGASAPLLSGALERWLMRRTPLGLQSPRRCI